MIVFAFCNMTSVTSFQQQGVTYPGLLMYHQVHYLKQGIHYFSAMNNLKHLAFECYAL